MCVQGSTPSTRQVCASLAGTWASEIASLRDPPCRFALCQNVATQNEQIVVPVGAQINSYASWGRLQKEHGVTTDS